MSPLLAILGPSGVGKTTLAMALARQGGFALALEQHLDRPFQTLLTTNSHYALANQLDYLLLRAEQETELRAAPEIGLLDGGLEMDFHIFTRLFAARGLLSPSEFELCQRFYTFARRHQPPPELFILLAAAPKVICNRLANRRRINIARPEDIPLMDAYLREWSQTIPPERLLRLNISNAAPDYREILPGLLTQIRARLMA